MKKNEVVIMAYREAELLAMVERDAEHPDLLFTKDYIEKDGVTADTGKAYEEVVLSWLLSHTEKIRKTDHNWSMYRTVVKKSSEGGSRQTMAVLSQGHFARGLALDMEIVLKDSRAEVWGRFPLASMDRTGRMLTLYDMRPEAEEEKPLCRLLRLWSWKESVNRLTVAKALGREAPFMLKAAVLITGASNERYSAGKSRVSTELSRLGVLLGVSSFYLFHGIHLFPVNRGLPLYGQYTRGELLSLIEKDSAHPETLYQKEYVNRMGVTSDTEEPYCKVLGEWLLAHREMWMTLPRGMYRRVEGVRAEKILKNGLWAQVRKQKVLPPFGGVLPEDLVFLGSRFQQTGQPVMMLADEAGDSRFLVRLLEIPETSDTLLGAVLRSFTHLVMVDGDRLMKEMKLPKESSVESRILLEEGNPQTDRFLRDLPCLSPLMKAMGVGLAMVEKGYEALW